MYHKLDITVVYLHYIENLYVCIINTQVPQVKNQHALAKRTSLTMKNGQNVITK